MEIEYKIVEVILKITGATILVLGVIIFWFRIVPGIIKEIIKWLKIKN